VPLSKVATATRWSVASEHPLGSLSGYDILKEGGNAADAAAAVAFTIAVVQHPLGGLGGDFFALYYEAKTGRVHCINSSGWAPTSMSVDFLKSKKHARVPLYGPESTVVPGFVKGVHSFQQRFGNKDFGDLLSDAVHYAGDGFPVTHGLSRSIGLNFEHLSEPARRVFGPSGKPLGPGGILLQTNLAKTIRDISENGPDVFYSEGIADDMCEELTSLGVPFEKRDFDFEPEWVEPLSISYRGAEVYEIPPNSMGPTTLLMLDRLGKRDVSKLGPASTERVKLLADTAREAYARMEEMLGDPRFVPFDLGEFLGSSGGAGIPHHRENADTTSFAVADEEGNVVGAIQSLFHHFGSRVYIDSCGILMNNRGSSFKFEGPNRVEPRKRPLHTLSVLMMEKEESVSAICCSGGAWRPQQHTLFATNILDYGMSLEDAIDFPRAILDGRNVLQVEAGYSGLETLDYEVNLLPHPGRTGVAHGVESNRRTKKGVCDVRGDGIPACG